MSKPMKKSLTEHDVDAAEIQAGVARHRDRLRFALWLAFIVGCTFVLKTCVESPPKLPPPAVLPSIECASRGWVWHPEKNGFLENHVEAYCGPAVPCAEKK
jgi:hypothetical protein